jgi:hypothetical protein
MMRIRNWGVVIPLLAMSAFALPSSAATGLFATEDAAAQSCGSDEVVWVDLDRGRFYHKSQSDYGKGGNGGYTCQKAAKLQYREAH